MTVMSKCHEELTDGVGKCSVPMFCMGCPAGLCDEPAYGERPSSKQWYNAHSERWMRCDGRYDGYVPGLACRRHGGPELKDVAHQGDPCASCGVPHDDVKVGPCPGTLA